MRADVVVDVTAKAPAALGQAVERARTGGTIALAGTRGSAETPRFWPDNVVYKVLRMLGALDIAAYRAALDLLAAGRSPFAELPGRCAGLGETARLLGDMAGGDGADGLPPVHGVVLP